MVTVGGEISGYWAIGRIDADTSPASTMMMARTLAKMGRSMKNLDMASFLPPVAGRAGAWVVLLLGRRGAGLGRAGLGASGAADPTTGTARTLAQNEGRYRRAGPQFHEVVDDELVTKHKTQRKHPDVARPAGGLHRLGHDFV